MTSSKPKPTGGRPAICPACESPIVWTGPNTGECVCTDQTR